jgi:hypothetical protein
MVNSIIDGNRMEDSRQVVTILYEAIGRRGARELAK